MLCATRAFTTDGCLDAPGRAALACCSPDGYRHIRAQRTSPETARGWCRVVLPSVASASIGVLSVERNRFVRRPAIQIRFGATGLARTSRRLAPQRSGAWSTQSPPRCSSSSGTVNVSKQVKRFTEMVGVFWLSALAGTDPQSVRPTQKCGERK